MKPLIIGSRGSPLALAQTKLVMADLKKKWPGQNFEIHVIKTEGDRLADLTTTAGMELNKGLFTSELEQALLNDKIDLAVHSLKDMPTEEADGLMFASIPKRASAQDVLITRSGNLNAELPVGAVIATGSPRRAAQLQLVRADFRTEEIRGNIDTRLKKFRANPAWSALILAAAGLERLKPDTSGLYLTLLPYDQMLPAPGQGALVIQTRKERSADVRKLVAGIHDPATAAAVMAERMFLHALGGGCSEPIAAYARVENEMLVMDGVAWLIGEKTPRRGTMTKRIDQAQELGIELAVKISQ